jgi:hypothetical protein
MNRCLHTNPLAAGGAAFNLWLMAAVLQAPAGASAQEALRNSLALQALAETNVVNLETIPYTVKSGDFRLLVTPSVGVQWNDNINLSSSNPQQDYIVTPMVRLDANYPITQFNLLRLDVGVGYAEYLEHSQYSAWQVNSGSRLSFDTYIKDFLINLHDRASYSQDPAAQAGVAETANYAIANNVVGVTGAWTPKDMNVSLGYDHENIISPTPQFQLDNSSSELFDGRAGWRFLPTASAGIEGTYTIMSYNQAILNNNTAYTAGVYGEWRPDTYFLATARGGYTIFQFQQTSESSETIELTPTPTGSPIFVLTGKRVQTSDLNSWYADLTLTHAVTRALSYSLSAGHEIQQGFLSDTVEDSYLRVSAMWNIIKNLDLKSTFSYEHGQEGVGNVAGNLTDKFDWYTGGVDLSRQLTSKLRLSLTSRVTCQSSSSTFFRYTQATVGMQLAYKFE